MNPAISIIVPVHNIESYISKCLNSILTQTFADLEVIIVNDGSTDESGNICDKYARKDSRVKVIHQEYGGVSAARNAGLAAVRGKYIGFVDGDDYVVESMYEKLYQLCMDTGSDIAICHLSRTETDTVEQRNDDDSTIEMDQHEALGQLFTGQLYRFSLCNKLFKRDCFKDIDFPKGRIHEDLATTYKLFTNASKCIYSNFTGYIYVKRHNSILTSKFNQDRLDAFTAWKEILLFMETYHRPLLPEVYACYGYWTVDNVYYAINQTDHKEREIYLSRIQQHMNRYYKKLLKNNLLSVKYKLLIRMIHYNVRFLVIPRLLKSLFKKEIIN